MAEGDAPERNEQPRLADRCMNDPTRRKGHVFRIHAHGRKEMYAVQGFDIALHPGRIVQVVFQAGFHGVGFPPDHRQGRQADPEQDQDNEGDAKGPPPARRGAFWLFRFGQAVKPFAECHIVFSLVILFFSPSCLREGELEGEGREQKDIFLSDLVPPPCVPPPASGRGRK